MISFTTEEIKCRSQVIGSYFGDDLLKACGICDNCLRQKVNTMTREEFEMIHLKIERIAQKQTVQIKDLLLQLNGIKKEKAWKVIEFLQAENKIEMDRNGWIRIKQVPR